MKCSGHPTLRQRVQALPQELQDHIQEEVFTSGPDIIIIGRGVLKGRLKYNMTTSTECKFPPPGLLRVSRATRKKILRSYYSETTFILPNDGFVRRIEKLRSFKYPRLALLRDIRMWCEHAELRDGKRCYECSDFSYCFPMITAFARDSQWPDSDSQYEEKFVFIYYENSNEACNALEKEGIHVRHLMPPEASADTMTDIE